MSLTVTAALVASLLAPAHAAHYTPMGKEVACTDVSKRITGKNIISATLWWYQLDTSWCWDRRMVITRGRWHTSEDTPGLCWSFEGEGPGYSEGGKGSGRWSVTRSGKFKCAIGSATFYRYPSVTIDMKGGGTSD